MKQLTLPLSLLVHHKPHDQGRQKLWIRRARRKLPKKSSVKSTLSSDGRNVETKATLGEAREKKKKKMLAEPTSQVQGKLCWRAPVPKKVL
jgi:hypothetical protein